MADLKNMRLSERSQMPKAAHCVIPLAAGVLWGPTGACRGAGGGEGGGKRCWVGRALGLMGMSWTGGLMVAPTARALKATDLLTLKRLILWYMDFNK